MVSMYLAVVALVAVERLGELALSRRNQRRSIARGAVEAGAEHFPWMALLHSGFLLACVAEVTLFERPFSAFWGGLMLGLVVLAQALRYWAILSLGDRWNVRVLAVPGEPACERGPYKYLRHPNYVAVVIEGLALPLAHGAWLTAVAFSALNALLLRTRIRCEERALREHCGYAEGMAAKPRFLPRPATRAVKEGPVAWTRTISS